MVVVMILAVVSLIAAVKHYVASIVCLTRFFLKDPMSYQRHNGCNEFETI